MNTHFSDMENRSRARRTHGILISIVTTLLIVTQVSLAPIFSSTARADARINTLIRATLLGDSYSAGNGAGAYYGDKEAYRSHNNWAHKYVEWLNSQGTPTVLTNLAHSGNVTNDLTKSRGQIDEMSEDTNLVMFTIGGNDVNFSDIVKECFTLGLRDAKTCKEKVADANTKLESVKSNTLTILQKIDNKLKNDAQVILVGYPRLATNRNYILDNSGVRYDAGAGVRSLSDASMEIQSTLVQEWNKSHPSLKVTYIDGVINTFDGHEPDPSPKHRNPQRWINEFLETEGKIKDNGQIESESSSDTNEFYHPNITGHAEIAKLIAEKVGVPTFNNQEPSTKSDIDIAFVIDSTGSMKDNVGALRARVNEIMKQTEKGASSYRFALIDYKDHPKFNTQNYLARTDVDFTSDGSVLEKGLDSLTYEGGNLGNTNASVYSGVMQAVNLKWRNGVKKIVVVIGDAPPRDPEPGTGYTAASVAKAAYEVDPVSVYGIDTGQLSSSEFQNLVSSSSGTTASASSPDQVSDLVNKAISSELNKPFAWIQGPYVAKVGDPVDIDAAASHAVSGSLTSYEWDFNGDGVYDETGTSPRITHAFSEEFSGVIGLRVTQSDGQTVVATTQVDITDDGDNTPRDQDNCPDVSNWGQTDYDNDGVGDECDPDPGFPTQDKPGVCVVGENCPPDSGTPSTQPTPAPSGGSTPTPAVAPAPTQTPTASPTTTASKRPLPNTGINASRLTALAILGLLTGAAVLHYRRKVTS
ncbi:VWA domain-containing protein [Actinomyces oris]|uniref:VWA domain-containing protein n=1 Tax=Actinomyces oris TaxID=544580 RepID=UPI0028D29B87|nr:VWA domain-containing protein [Actinomyces oris]